MKKTCFSYLKSNIIKKTRENERNWKKLFHLYDVLERPKDGYGKYKSRFPHSLYNINGF